MEKVWGMDSVKSIEDGQYEGVASQEIAENLWLKLIDFVQKLSCYGVSLDFTF